MVVVMSHERLFKRPAFKNFGCERASVGHEIRCGLCRMRGDEKHVKCRGSGATPFIINEVMISSTLTLLGLMGVDIRTVNEVTVLGDNMTDGRLQYLKSPEKIPIAKSQTIRAKSKRTGATGLETDLEPQIRMPKTRTLAAAMAAAMEGTAADPKAKDAALPGIIIGQEMAKNLKVFMGDVVNVVSPVGELGPTGPVPKARAFRIAGLFYSGMYEYDSKFVYIDLAGHKISLQQKGL